MTRFGKSSRSSGTRRRETASRSGHGLRVTFPLFQAIGVQLQQILLNLIMNAIEAMSGVEDRSRELMITTRNIAADQVQVSVADSGIGIDPQKLDKIFDSFYTTKPSGMGMGLSISRSILQAHGGRRWGAGK